MENLSDFQKIKNWNREDLKKWLRGISSAEGLFHEFKCGLPIGSDKGKKSLRKSFCAFANTKGGYIFFGVEDKSRKAVEIRD